MKKNVFFLSAIMVFSVLLLSGCGDEGTNDYNAGVAAMKKGEYSKACTQFTTAIRNNTTQPEYYISYGMALLQLSRYGEAASSFKKALNYSEGNNENIKRSYRGLGIAYYFQKKLDLAEKNLHNALVIRELPDLNLECYNYLGALNDATGDTKDAYDAYKKVLEIDSEKFSAIVGKYKAEIALGKKKEAKKTLKAGLKCETKTAEDQYMYAKLQFYNEDFKGAEEELLKAADSYEEAYIFLGQIKMADNDFEGAIQCFENYVEQTGEEMNLTICSMMAKCYISTFEYKKAVEWVEKGIEVDASDSELQTIRYSAVVVYEYLEKFKKAYALAKEYSDIYPDDERFSNALVHLKNLI